MGGRNLLTITKAMEQETETEQRISRQKQELLETLDEYFNRGVEKGKFIDTSRIPLICQDISNIHKSVAKLEDNTGWIVRLIIGAIVLALLGLVLVKPKPETNNIQLEVKQGVSEALREYEINQ